MTDKITPEMLRVAAEAVGCILCDDPEMAGLNPKVLWIAWKPTVDWVEWNPVTKGYQDRMLRDWLLGKGFAAAYGDCEGFMHQIWHMKSVGVPTSFNCPPNEFLTRAVYAVKGER